VHLHLTHASLGPPDSTSQTASRPQFSRFCTPQGRSFLYFTMGRPFPSKLPLRMAPWGWTLIHGPWADSSPQAKRHLDRFSGFCRAHDRDKQTDRQRDEPLYSVCNNRPHLRSTAMRPNNYRLHDGRRLQFVALLCQSAAVTFKCCKHGVRRDQQIVHGSRTPVDNICRAKKKSKNVEKIAVTLREDQKKYAYFREEVAQMTLKVTLC